MVAIFLLVVTCFLLNWPGDAQTVNVYEDRPCDGYKHYADLIDKMRFSPLLVDETILRSLFFFFLLYL